MGIPPSLDRIRMQHRLIAGAAVLGAVCFAVMWLVYREAPVLSDAQTPAQATRPGEEDRGEAFGAAQLHLLDRLNAERVVDVAWRDTRHQGHYGYYTFEGTMAAQATDGAVHPITYVIAVFRDDDGAWAVDRIELAR